MSERCSLQKVFEGILSSQSFELLQDFSDDSTWGSLSSEERDLLVQLFLLKAEAMTQEGKEKAHIQKAYETACRLSPQSARVWYRLGVFLALSEEPQDLQEAFLALHKAVAIESRFFDAQYAFASVSLRLAVLKGDESLLFRADASFFEASTLLEEKSLGAEFYWHWGIVWSVIAKYSEEPCDCHNSIVRYEKAKLLGCSRPDFFNDYANALVEFSLAISNDDCISQAITLYTNAIAVAQSATAQEKSVWYFNLGCCYQHLFEKTSEKRFFEKSNEVFEITSSLYPDLPTLWNRWGILLFRGWRIWQETSLAKEVLVKFHEAEQKGTLTAVELSLIAQALLWLSASECDYEFCLDAIGYAKKAKGLQEEQGEEHPEVFAALALCLYEQGKYFAEASLFEEALSILQDAISVFPKSAIIWHAIAYTKASYAELTGDISFLQDAATSFSVVSKSFFAQSPQFFLDWACALLTLAEITDDPLLALEAVNKLEYSEELFKERNIDFLYHLGRAFHILGDICDEEEYYSRSIALLTEAFLQDDTNLSILYKMACSYLHMGELTLDTSSFVMARLFFEELLTIDPENDDAWSDYALALIHIGKDHRVGEEIPEEWFLAEEALYASRGLGQPYALYHLASLYALMGNFEEAMEALYKALDEGELPEIDDMLADEWLEPLIHRVCFHTFLEEFL